MKSGKRPGLRVEDGYEASNSVDQDSGDEESSYEEVEVEVDASNDDTLGQSNIIDASYNNPLIAADHRS